LCAILLLAAQPALAKRLYKYQDENGVWHYTDSEPQTSQPVQSRVMDVDPEPRLQVQKVGTPRHPAYKFLNKYYGPMQLQVTAPDAVNLQSDPPLPATFVLPARAERQLFTLGPADPRQSWKFRLSFTYIPGQPGAQPDGTLYRLPFPPGERFVISQAAKGVSGGHTHNTPDSRDAVDIVMPEGTEVRAARGGVVMDVANDFHRHGTDMDTYGARANHVRVLHDDGTMAIYAHLKLEGVVVRPGENVRAGDLLAYSGNTGFSTGPHLHFCVQRNAGMQLVSVPFEFAGPDGQPVEPRAGMVLGGR